MSKAKPRTIDVEIYDQRYTIVLKSSVDESEVRKLAEEIDERMREISRIANTADSLKLAVLTALHLAQEVREFRSRCDQWSDALEEVLTARRTIP